MQGRAGLGVPCVSGWGVMTTNRKHSPFSAKINKILLHWGVSSILLKTRMIKMPLLHVYLQETGVPVVTVSKNKLVSFFKKGVCLSYFMFCSTHSYIKSRNVCILTVSHVSDSWDQD